MGKLAEQVQTRTKVAEQVTNKSLVITSSVVNFFANIDSFGQKFKDFVMKHYFPSLFKEKVKSSIASKKYKLLPEERNLLSTINPIEITSQTLVHNINKIKLNKYIISTNDFSVRNNEQNNNQFIKSQDGKYYLIYKIVQVGKDIYLFVHEYLNPLSYTAKDRPFPYLKYTSHLSTTLQIIKSSDIDVPFSMVFFNDLFILYDLFSRHR